MAIRRSTGLRTRLLGGTGGTKGIKTLMDGGVLDIFTGAQPTTADYVETGTLLARISSTSGTIYNGCTNGLRFGTASNGVLGLTTPKWEGSVLATGVAGWFRFYGTGATSGTSADEVRFDGAVGVSGADLNLTHTSLDADTVLTITAFNITEPAQ